MWYFHHMASDNQTRKIQWILLYQSGVHACFLVLGRSVQIQLDGCLASVRLPTRVTNFCIKDHCVIQIPCNSLHFKPVRGCIFTDRATYIKDFIVVIDE
jgi:hypothetical protein